MTSAMPEFEGFIYYLNSTLTSYFVAWGYEELPEKHSGGDVDICIHPHHYGYVADELRHRGYSSTKCPNYDNEHHHEHFTRSGCYTLDLFDSFCFAYNGRTVVLKLDPFYLFKGFRRKGKISIASPTVELLFTSLRIIGGRKDYIKKLEKYLE